MTLTDASPLFALVDKNQAQARARCEAVLPKLSRPLVTTWPAFTEAMYLVYREGGWPLQRVLWRYVTTGELIFHIPDQAAQERMAELMEQYRDRPMDLADASLVVTAETLNLTRIFTLDSDFYAYRIKGKGAFEVVP